MTLKEKQKIIKLREVGLSYSQIASEVSMPIGTIRYVCGKKEKIVNTELTYCLNCGNTLKLVVGKKAKKYCCNKCRYDYHNKARKGGEQLD